MPLPHIVFYDPATKIYSDPVRFGSDGAMVNNKYEWGKKAAENLYAAMGILQTREQELFGESLSLEQFARDKGSIVIAPDAYVRTLKNATAGGIYADESHRTRQTDEGEIKIPATMFNSKYCFDQNTATFLLAQQMSKFLNMSTSDRYEHLNFYESFEQPTLIHGKSPLLSLALQLDTLQADQGNMDVDKSLSNFTARRTAIKGADKDKSGKFYLEDTLSDMYASLVTSIHPKFPDSPNFNEQKFPIESQLVEKYTRNAFVLDMLYRKNPADPLYKKLARKLMDPNAGLDEKRFKEIEVFTKFALQHRTLVNKEELGDAIHDVSQVLQPFERELMAAQAARSNSMN